MAAPPTFGANPIPRVRKRVRDAVEPGARTAAWLVYVAALYAFVLCFVNTRLIQIAGSTPLVAVEFALLTIALILLSLRMSIVGVAVCLALALNFCVLSIARDNVDVKSLRDLLMLVIFTWLGYAYGTPSIAERTLRVVACIAVVVGIVELTAPEFYKSFFDTARFYESRGLSSNKFVLQVLLERPTGIGRTILPFLGPRRISSIFLEPVSMGNFAVIIGAWALAKDRVEWRQAVSLMALACAVIVLADARFGGLALTLIAIARLTGAWKVRWLHAFFPVAGMALTVAVAWLREGVKWTDDFLGRLLLAGEHLRNLDVGAWLGIPQLLVYDAGYGYVVQQFGVLMCMGLWCVYCLLPMDERGQRFRFSASLYIALILAVSGTSLFALKTAAMLSFLLGSLIVHGKRFRAPAAAATPPRTVKAWAA